MATLLLAVAAGLAAGPPVPAAAQSLVERPPNLQGTALPRPGSPEFTFLHRFELLGDQEKLVNYPTLVLAFRLPAGFALGATYTSNSEIGAGTPNEWELAGRRRFVLGRRVDLAVTGAWNSAAESLDGELGVRARLGKVSLFGVARGLTSAYGADDPHAVAGGGILFHLTSRLAAGGDVARVVSSDTFPTAWSAGVHLVVPGSPHTLGFAVSNVGSTTLQGASRGIEDPEGDVRVRYGFAFTLPLGTLAQWSRIVDAEAASEEADVVIRDFAFGPGEVRIRAGETVRWMNEDEAGHSVTADDGSFDSGVFGRGEGYARRFDTPGRYPYHCTPHPFMRGAVVVEPR